MADCRVNHNKAMGVTSASSGGGLFCQTDSSLSVVDSFFMKNRAYQCGAGVYLQNSLPASFIHCNLSYEQEYAILFKFDFFTNIC